MRAGLLVLLIAACGPKVASTPHTVEDDLDMPPPGATQDTAAPATADPAQPATIDPAHPGTSAPARPAPTEPARPAAAPTPWPPTAAPSHTPPPPAAATNELPDYQRVMAPPGKGLRTGTITRDHLIAVLNAGPGNFLRQLEVAPRLAGDRFVGWQLVQLLDRTGPLTSLDLVSGDVLLAINGNPLSRPEQLQTMWDSLRTANEVTAHLWRGDKKFDLRFKIEPQVH